MMRYRMGKMRTEMGVVTMTDAGTFTFEGPDADFMRRWMSELQANSGLSGEPALDAFMRDFSHGSYWFKEVP